MPELSEGRAAVVQVIGEPAALDALEAAVTEAFPARVAPDEALLLGPRAARQALLAAARHHMQRADPDGLVVDQTDGWTVFSIRGHDADRLFRHLSVLPLPGQRPALVQGGFAQVPARTLFTEDGLHVLVGAPVAHHVRGRIEAVGAPLGLTAGAPTALQAARPGIAPRA